jgi:demethylmenaquinone methyltransferase/2-methoxy-6-polyprenyl-1,4-benzoquinol methylase
VAVTIDASKSSPVPGTRPEGARDERESAARVRAMFTRIAPRYDFLNHFLSFSLDKAWRRRTANRFLHILRRPDARILDLCCGTGDLAFALDHARSRVLGASEKRSAIVGADFVEPMLALASEKARTHARRAVFAGADALRLPFPDASFDLVTTAFGFRNLANYEEGLREFARVLRKGGELGILEFTEPGSGATAGLFRFYFRHLLPRIGGAISGDREAYAYLPGSVSKFPSPPALAALMARTGFEDVRFTPWNFGSVVLHSATRRQSPVRS